MGKYTQKDIDYIANHLRRRKEDDGKPFNLLTGAGCSLSAGIPLAPTLTKEINEIFKDDCERKLNKKQCQDYGSCMSILSKDCLLYTSPSPRDATLSRMPSSA